MEHHHRGHMVMVEHRHRGHMVMVSKITHFTPGTWKKKKERLVTHSLLLGHTSSDIKPLTRLDRLKVLLPPNSVKSWALSFNVCPRWTLQVQPKTKTSSQYCLFSYYPNLVSLRVTSVGFRLGRSPPGPPLRGDPRSSQAFLYSRSWKVLGPEREKDQNGTGQVLSCQWPFPAWDQSFSLWCFVASMCLLSRNTNTGQVLILMSFAWPN